MNKNYTPWIIGAVVVLVLAFVLSMQGSSSTPTTTGTTDTSGTETATTGNPTKPFAATTGFASVSTTTAVVAGTVNPDGAETTYWFEYGQTLSFGFKTSMVTVPAGYKQVGAAAYITNLQPNTPYYFRVGAKNAYGTVYGGPYNFITLPK